VSPDRAGGGLAELERFTATGLAAIPASPLNAFGHADALPPVVRVG
jgi:hypothetical protein